ncbi:MAG: hypothetical protein QXK24_00005, partial [Ignisphaera sp.]
FMNSRIYRNTSGRKLAELCGFIPINSLRNNIKGDVLIRYGVSSYPTRDKDFRIVLNKAEDIKRVINKKKASLYMMLHNIKTPKIFLNKEEIARDNLPVLARSNFHSRGTDIEIIDTMNKLRNSIADYYVEFIKGNLEYRLHVFNNEPIRLQKKIPKNGEHIIRNVEHGYILADHYTHNIPIELQVIKEGLKAVKLFNLDFGAVDVLVGEDNTPYILEINTAPRLNKYGIQLYAYYIKQYLGIEDSLNNYSRLKYNNGENGLPILFRDIIHRDRRNVYD